MIKINGKTFEKLTYEKILEFLEITLIAAEAEQAKAPKGYRFRTKSAILFSGVTFLVTRLRAEIDAGKNSGKLDGVRPVHK